MGTGCSGSLPSKQIKQREQSLTEKSSNHGSKAQKSSTDGTTIGNKLSAQRPLSRVVGFVSARSISSGIDIGSKSSNATLRSNSFWTHEDDDRIDDLINRWAAAEVLYLKVPIRRVFPVMY